MISVKGYVCPSKALCVTVPMFIVSWLQLEIDAPKDMKTHNVQMVPPKVQTL